MERLQVLGLFPRPLAHPQAKDCLKFVWSYFQDVLFKSQLAGLDGEDKEERAEELLLEEVEKFVLQSPEPDGKPRLPKPNESVKIRLPGTFTGFYDHMLEEDMPFQQASDRFEVEQIRARRLIGDGVRRAVSRNREIAARMLEQPAQRVLLAPVHVEATYRAAKRAARSDAR